MTCPSCHAETPGTFPFCPFCGSALAAPAEGALQEERKVVSVLFCDLVGFTAASEHADPEDVRARIRPYGQRVRAEIEAFGGTVEKFVGDAVMAVFGAPLTHEDDAERAVRAGLRVLEALAELNANDAQLQLEVRIGIATGEVLVALGAGPDEGLVSGDVVNTGARIQAAAPVDGVAVSEATYRATERVFVYEPLPPAVLKGKSEPVALFRAVASRARFGSDVIRDHTRPFVGREVERTLLRSLFERSVRDSSLQVVTLVGEPGIGKSRLVADLLAHVDSRPELVTWRQGRCLPYGEGITFWALGEIVKAHAGIFDADDAETATAKLDAILPDVDERAWLRARLLPLLGIDGGVAPSREESFAAWRRFLEEIASDPAVLIFEDVHWADAALLEFITDVAEWVQGVPLLLVCTARPELFERHPSWSGGLRNAHTVNLSPLSEQETGELVRALVERAVSTDVQQTILERSGGNPLYAEEFVRLAAEQGVQGTFPDSVQALIAARLDQLPADRKRLLQDAAVLGKVFWAGALAEMGDRERREVELALHDLGRRELVRPMRTSSVEGDAEYAFWHALVRDVAYGQIPRAERARRHRLAAEWIERTGETRLEDQADLVAHHYVQALDLAEASGADDIGVLRDAARAALVLAGERAFPLDAVRATALLERALDLFDPADPERLDVFLRWALGAASAGRVAESVEALEAEVARVPVEEPERRAAALMMLARTSVVLAAKTAAVEEAVSLLEPLGEAPLLVEALGLLSGLYAFTDATRGVEAADRAVAVAGRIALPTPAALHGRRGFARVLAGDLDGLSEAEAALEALVAEGAGREAAGLFNNLAVISFAAEGPAASLALMERGAAFCRQRGLPAITRSLEGNALTLVLQLGRPGEVVTRGREILTEIGQSGDVHNACIVRVILAGAYELLGEPQRALGEVEAGLAAFAGDAAPDILAHAAAARAPALLALGRSDEARAELQALADGSPYLVLNMWEHVPALATCAAILGEPEAATRLAAALAEGKQPLHRYAHREADGLAAEARGDLAAAVDGFEAAIAGWRAHDMSLALARALLALGRCRRQLGDGRAREALVESRALFEEMGAEGPLATLDAMAPAVVA